MSAPFKVSGFMCGGGECVPMYRENRQPPTVDELIQAYREGAQLLRLAGKERSAAILDEFADFEEKP